MTIDDVTRAAYSWAFVSGRGEGRCCRSHSSGRDEAWLRRLEGFVGARFDAEVSLHHSRPQSEEYIYFDLQHVDLESREHSTFTSRSIYMYFGPRNKELDISRSADLHVHVDL